MRNIKLVLEYDGTEYSGWQVQDHMPTVEGIVTEAIEKMAGEDIKLNGCSRTDAGVHAYGYVANFLTSSGISADAFLRGLNSLIPEDIVVREAVEAPEDFDARRDATGKTYVYRIVNRGFRSALMQRYSWYVHQPLDLERMRRAGRFFIGEKDFTSFRAAGSDAPHSVREVTSVEVIEAEDGVVEIVVKGRSFLRHMVRIMVGTLVTVGMGKLKPEEVEDIIEARDRCAAPVTAPAQGLFLAEVRYPGDGG